jgi:DNA-binding beta-propeller fold protein YncE
MRPKAAAMLFCVIGIAAGLEALDLREGDSTKLLPTGVGLDPVGDVLELGSMPLGMAFAPDGNGAVVILSGWREQGIQVVDLKAGKVTQTVKLDAAFSGLAFSPDGRELYVSGGNDDVVIRFSWINGSAVNPRRIVLGQPKADKTGSRYPAGIAVSAAGSYLYVAENVGDSLAVIDLATSRVVERFPTDHYPYAVDVAANGFVSVSAWGGDTISMFQARPDGRLTFEGRLRVGRHPSALLSNATGSRLFVALGGTDQIAIVDTSHRRVIGYLSDAPPAGPSEGSTPNALALSSDGSRLFVAEADNNAVAIFDVSGVGGARLEGRIPTDWYPTAVAARDQRLLVLCGKGHGSRANPDGPTPGRRLERPLGYDLGQLSGTLRIVPSRLSASRLTELSGRVASANHWTEPRKPGRYPPFRHVVYVIKENRTYDQVLGDLKEGDGDASLVFFGREVSPNHHALALRFGLFDRFFTNAEVSSQGHLWSTAAYVSDYGEKTIPSMYSDRRADVDGEEAVEPADGFLWTLAAKKGIHFRDYGEMVGDPEAWPVTQRELGSDISPIYPPSDLKIPDQKRADAWIAELERFVAGGEMPALEVMHLPGDHTAGGKPGYRTPLAYMADNDLALGRIVEALSKSPFWRDTVVFVLEDDSQSGPDHVDSHRSPLLVISAYNRRGAIHRFANTTDVLAAIEDILSLGNLSKFDYFSRSLAEIFTDSPDLAPYHAITPSVSLDEVNPKETPAAHLSERFDFSAPDKVEDAQFNEVLWLMLKGGEPPPLPHSKASLHALQLSH